MIGFIGKMILIDMVGTQAVRVVREIRKPVEKKEKKDVR